MNTYVGLNTLKNVGVLFPGDFHDVAAVWLKLRKARQLNGESKCTPTVHGVAGVFAQLSGLTRESVEDMLASQGVNAGWVVDFDEFIA